MAAPIAPNQGMPQERLPSAKLVDAPHPASFAHQLKSQQHRPVDGPLPTRGWLRATTTDLPVAPRGSFDARHGRQDQSPLRHTSHDVGRFGNHTDHLEWDSVRELQERVRANEQFLSAERARSQMSMSDGNQAGRQQMLRAPWEQGAPLAVNNAGSSNSSGSGVSNSIQYVRTLTKQLEVRFPLNFFQGESHRQTAAPRLTSLLELTFAPFS